MKRALKRQVYCVQTVNIIPQEWSQSSGKIYGQSSKNVKKLMQVKQILDLM